MRGSLFASVASQGSLLIQGTKSQYQQAPLGMGTMGPAADLE